MKGLLSVGLMLLVALAALVLSSPAFVISQQEPSHSADTSSAGLKVGGAVVTPLDLSAADLKSLPRKTMKTVNPHSQKDESYEGVALREPLHRAGTPEGENLRGVAMTTYVVAEGPTVIE